MKKAKLKVPHGYFSRRFTHKRKRFLGTRLEVFDAHKQRWVNKNTIELDYALACMIEALPKSNLSYPSPHVTSHFVEHGFESWEREQMAKSESIRQDQEAHAKADAESIGSSSKESEHETLDRTRNHAVNVAPIESAPNHTDDFYVRPSEPAYTPSESSFGSSSSSYSSSSDSGSSFGGGFD